MAYSRPCKATSHQVRLACLHRVPRHCSCTVLRALLPNSSDCPCTSGHIVLDLGCCRVPHRTTGGVRSPARTRALQLRPCGPNRESTPRPEPGVCGCWQCICGEPSAFQSQWLETRSEGFAFLFNIAVGFVNGVCTCVTLCCAQRGVSRETIL